MEVGTALIECIEGVQDLDLESQYATFLEAGEYVAEMKSAYDDMLDACGGDHELNRIAYQLRLLEYSCPDAVESSAPSALADQVILYRLYLRQIASSFNFLSEDMAYLAGTGSAPDPISYFEEVPEMPMPDSVIYGIVYDSEKTDSGVKQYMYLIGDNESDANMNYNIYLSAVGLCDGLEVEITDTYAYVTKDGTMVSAMMAGTDASLGYFLIVSFQE